MVEEVAMRKVIRVAPVRSSWLEEQHRRLLMDYPQATQLDDTREQPLPEYVKFVDSIATYGVCEEPVI